jgi:hypothetical protein
MHAFASLLLRFIQSLRLSIPRIPGSTGFVWCFRPRCPIVRGFDSLAIMARRSWNTRFHALWTSRSQKVFLMQTHSRVGNSMHCAISGFT